MGSAMIQDDAVAEREREAPRKLWRAVGQVLGRAAVSTGRGTAWLAKASFHNRHYLPSLVHGAIGDKLREYEGFWPST